MKEFIFLPMNGKTYKIPKEFVEARLADGFDKEDIPQKYIEYLQMRAQIKEYEDRRNENGPREITSTTYEQAQRRMNGDVNNWFGRGMTMR